jgi:hypothetical protein
MPVTDTIDPCRRLFAELVADYNRSLGKPASEALPGSADVSVIAACAGVEFALKHSMARNPQLLRIVCNFGDLPEGEQRQPALVKLLELQHTMAMAHSILSVDAEGETVCHSIALPLAGLTVDDMKRSILVMHARAMEWRRTRFLDAPGEDQLVRKAVELAQAAQTAPLVIH